MDLFSDQFNGAYAVNRFQLDHHQTGGIVKRHWHIVDACGEEAVLYTYKATSGVVEADAGVASLGHVEVHDGAVGSRVRAHGEVQCFGAQFRIGSSITERQYLSLIHISEPTRPY